MLHDFIEIHRGPLHAFVRRGLEGEARLLAPLSATGDAEWVGGGRAEHPVVRLSDQTRALIRSYRRGGALRHLNRSRYFVGHRAHAELRATEAARAAGVRVPEVLAAVERRGTLGYTAALATRWIEGARELAGWLEGRSTEARTVALEAVGRGMGDMHRGGVAHPDLNLRNVLVVDGASGAPEVYLIDFDRARVYPAAVPRARRARDLRRLARSARKLRADITPTEWVALRLGYGAGWPLRSDLG